MMKWFKNLFSENSDVSMMRVMSFVCCVCACKLALTKGPEEVSVIVTLLSSAFGGKVIQKGIELKKVEGVKEDDGTETRSNK